MLELVRADVVPLRLTLDSLRGSGLSDDLIRCCGCGATAQTERFFVALERTASVKITLAPLPKAALRLVCVSCLASDAERSGVLLDTASVTRFVDRHCMGSFEACHQLQGFARGGAGGPGVGVEWF